jgi:hypothetical protein
MNRLHSAQDLTGYSIQAVDGVIGKIREIYFDDSTWAVRYFVTDVRRWLHKYVLLSPQALGRPDVGRHLLPASVTTSQIRNSPKIDTDLPIALQVQARLHRHYGWAFYWGAEALIGSTDTDVFSPLEPANAGGAPFDPHLRTTRVVAGHRVQAKDGVAGVVEDFLLDGASWTLRSLVVRLDDGRRVALPTPWVRQIRLETTQVFVDMPLETIRSCTSADSLQEEQEPAYAVAAHHHG